MKVKKCIALLSALIMAFAMTATAYADANAKWNAANGTAVVDGQKDDVYAGAQEMKMEAVSDGDGDGTAASSWAAWDAEAIYIFTEVTDNALDDTNSNVWEKDSVEFRIENKDQLVQAYAVAENFDGSYAKNVKEVKVLKTDKGYNVEMKIPYAAAEGSSVLFSLQVNCANGGSRKGTLHTNADLKDAWQNNSVFETLVFSSGAAAAAAEAPKTGVVSLGAFFGIGAIVSAAGAVICKKKKEA